MFLLFNFTSFGTCYLNEKVPAYQCDVESDMSNVQAFDLVDIDKCPLPPSPPKLKKRLVQVLQKVLIIEVDVLQCEVYLHAESWRCGMHDHMIGKFTY